MKLYLLTQSANRGYDTYDSLVVCANSESEAKGIRPDKKKRSDDLTYTWRAFKVEDVECKEIWLDNWDIEKWVILSSFNAG